MGYLLNKLIQAHPASDPAPPPLHGMSRVIRDAVLSGIILYPALSLLNTGFTYHEPKVVRNKPYMPNVIHLAQPDL